MLQVWLITRKFSGARVVVHTSEIASIDWLRAKMLRGIGCIGTGLSGFHRSPNYSKVVRASNFELNEWSTALDVLRLSDFEFERLELDLPKLDNLEEENKKLGKQWLQRINDFFVTE